METCAFPLCKSNSVRSGYCIGHAKVMEIPIKPKEQKPIPKISEKKKQQGIMVNTVEDAELEAAFLAFRKKMTGKCANCGGKSCKNDPKYWKFSAAHLLPKEHFPSIAKHPAVFIELCFWDQSCHTNFDNGMLDPTEMKCWPQMVKQFKILYPLIAKEERKRIPDCFMQTL